MNIVFDLFSYGLGEKTSSKPHLHMHRGTLDVGILARYTLVHAFKTFAEKNMRLEMTCVVFNWISAYSANQAAAVARTVCAKVWQTEKQEDL